MNRSKLLNHALWPATGLASTPLLTAGSGSSSQDCSSAARGVNKGVEKHTLSVLVGTTF